MTNNTITMPTYEQNFEATLVDTYLEQDITPADLAQLLTLPNIWYADDLPTPRDWMKMKLHSHKDETFILEFFELIPDEGLMERIYLLADITAFAPITSTRVIETVFRELITVEDDTEFRNLVVGNLCYSKPDDVVAAQVEQYLPNRYGDTSAVQDVVRRFIAVHDK